MTKKQQLLFLSIFLLSALLIVAMLSSNNSNKFPKTNTRDSLPNDSIDSNIQIASIDRNLFFFNEKQKLPFLMNLGNMRILVDTMPGELDSIFNRFLAENKDKEGFNYKITENTLYNRNVEYTENGGSAGTYFYRDAYLKIKGSTSKSVKIHTFFEGFYPTFEHIKQPALKNVEHILIYGNEQAMCGGIGSVSILLINKEEIVELKQQYLFSGDAETEDTEGMSKAELKKITTEYDTIEKIYLPVYQDNNLVFRGIGFNVPSEDESVSYYTQKIPENMNPANIYISEKKVIRTRSNYENYYKQDTIRVTDSFYLWDGNKGKLLKKISRKTSK